MQYKNRLVGKKILPGLKSVHPVANIFPVVDNIGNWDSQNNTKLHEKAKTKIAPFKNWK